MHVMVLTYGEPKKGYLNFTLGDLWATQPIVLLNLATLVFYCTPCWSKPRYTFYIALLTLDVVQYDF